MKVILRKSNPQLGEAGSVVQVKDGFARNYLIPQGIAQPATGENLRYLANLKSFRAKKQDHLQQQAEEMAAKLNGVTISVAKKTGEGDRLFGTVTHTEIADALAAKGVEVDRRKIVVADPIKTLGTYTVTVKLRGQVQAAIQVDVVRSA
jgi:large subunit ribosomal protein L9